ncbi:MAG TPA: proteasome subunit beta [Candidatus Diapherotrites archaeon]|uniref:Proteasome subunit beta n=1 Tax=Candidatus Iainarchaeum sp. TaxID=3101447 RepID=A0A7J4IX95_9ARCH|nr:proteasome subunit beta [Candidatus Diapherotrites archaeon]
MADMKTGTTTVGLIYDGGIVLAADKRASMGHIAYEDESEKIYRINESMAVTNAGDVGDSLTIIRFLKSHARLYEFERNERMSARAAATFLSNIMNANRYYPYIVQLVIGGFNGKPELFDLTPMGAILERDKYAVSGSGTEPALTTLDNDYKKGMSEKDAVALAVKAVEAAKKRDIYSGGVGASVYVIDAKGVREVPKDKVEKIVKELTSA